MKPTLQMPLHFWIFLPKYLNIIVGIQLSLQENETMGEISIIPNLVAFEKEKKKTL